MQEQQSEDFFVPAFILNLPPKSEFNRREKPGANCCENPTEDFLKGIQGWVEYFSLDECVE